MPEIKEKPKTGKPKGRRKSTGPPKQTGRLMKEKFIKELDQRKAQESGDSSYAVEQMEQVGYRGADEFVQSLRSDARKRSRAKERAPKTAESTGEAETGGVQADRGPRSRQQPANPPKERRIVEGESSFQLARPPGSGAGTARRRSRPGSAPRVAVKERGKGPSLQEQAPSDPLPPETGPKIKTREPGHAPLSSPYRVAPPGGRGRNSPKGFVEKGPNRWSAISRANIKQAVRV
mgnify:CR=1 FL=1